MANAQLNSSRNRNRNRKLQTSKAPLKSQAQGTSLFTSAASNQRGFPKSPVITSLHTTLVNQFEFLKVFFFFNR